MSRSEPESLEERTSNEVSPEDMKMLDHPEEGDSLEEATMEEQAEIDGKLLKEFDL